MKSSRIFAVIEYLQITQVWLMRPLAQADDRSPEEEE
jgi:hypothetical protein